MCFCPLRNVGGVILPAGSAIASLSMVHSGEQGMQPSVGRGIGRDGVASSGGQ